MPAYLYLLRPSRHEFFDNPTSQEEAALGEHFACLKQAAEQGMTLLVSPCLDETIVIFRAEDEAVARRFMYADPGVQQNVMMSNPTLCR